MHIVHMLNLMVRLTVVDVSIIHRIYMDCRLVTLGSVFLTYDAGPTLGMCGSTSVYEFKFMGEEITIPV